MPTEKNGIFLVFFGFLRFFAFLKLGFERKDKDAMQMIDTWRPTSAESADASRSIWKKKSLTNRAFCGILILLFFIVGFLSDFPALQMKAC